jgi:2-hydroxy-3-keto-5-methylthiopentenyl-1-phosphate phosphatase
MLIISDFSKTFTRVDMPSSWSVFAKSNLLGDGYNSDRDALYAQYAHFEKEGDIAMTEEWFAEHAELFITYTLTQEQIDQLVMDDRYFAPRDGVKEFLEYISQNSISLVIVTSGISQIAMTWLRKRYNYVPDIVFGTDLLMTEGVVTDFDPDSIITPLDKSIEIELEDENESIVLIGDSTEDTKVTPSAKMSLGFTDEER